MEASWGLFGPLGILLEASWGRLISLLGLLGSVLEASWAVLGLSWRPLDRPGGPLGASWRHLGGVLGPLGGQDPPGARGPRVLRPQEACLGLIFKTLFDVFYNTLETFKVPSSTVEYCTGEALEALHVEYS